LDKKQTVIVLKSPSFGGVRGGFLMKFNWGTGIVLAFVIMVSGMIYLVSIALRQNDDLVDNDYYQKSITYQQHIDEVRNNEALTEKIRFELSSESLKLSFPKLANSQEYEGEIHFYSPVEEKRDMTIKIKLDSIYSQIIDLQSLQKGRYQVKIDWKANKVSYYQQENIVLEQ
jgi:hypothetical protein